LKPVAMDQADDAESSLILCDNSAAVDGKDDDHGRYNLRCVLAAAAYNNTSRRLASNHMEASVDCFVSRYFCSPSPYIFRLLQEIESDINNILVQRRTDV